MLWGLVTADPRMALVRLLLHCPIGMGCVTQAVRLGQGIAMGDDAPHQAALAGGLWSPLTCARLRVMGAGACSPAIRTLLRLCWTCCNGLRELGCIWCFLSSCADPGWAAGLASPSEASHFSSASSTIMVLLSISGHRNAAGNTDLLLCNSSLLVPPLKWSFSS